MKRFLLALCLTVLAGGGLFAAVTVLGPAIAQDNERGRFVRFVERQISTPDRQIRLGSIDGALSSDVRISQITIADREGVWLAINDVHLVWSRLALLRGRLDVDLLEASSIELSRLPAPAEGEAEPYDDTPFQLPDLPVEVLLDRLDVPEVDIAAGVIGPAARLSVDGSVSLTGGALDTDITVERLDEPGSLRLVAEFDNDSRELAVDLAYDEPAGGVLANALNIEGRPQLGFTVNGSGPLDSYNADIALTSEGSRLLGGTVTLRQPQEGTRFALTLDGNLQPLVPALYQPLVTGGSNATIEVLRRPDQSVSISNGSLSSGVADLVFSAELAADFVPTALNVEGTLEREDGAPLALPGGGGEATIRGADINVTLDNAAGTFRAVASLSALDTANLLADTVEITADGTVSDLQSAGERALTFTVDGRAEGLSSDDPAIADALGSAVSIAANGAWQSGRPVTVENASVEGDDIAATFAGRVGDSVIGTFTLDAERLAPLSGLAGRDLSGAIDLSARGMVSSGGLFDLEVDATANDLSLGSAALDGLIGGTTRITGSAAREEERLAFQSLRVDGETLTVEVDGTLSGGEADLFATLNLADLSRIDERLSGGVEARTSVTGDPSTPTLALRVSSGGIGIAEDTVRNLEVAFDGVLDRDSAVTADLDGRLSANARINDEAAQISATLTSSTAGRRLGDLSLSILGARASGDLAVTPEQRLDGALTFDVPDLAPLARLALVEATGALSGTVTLRVADETQNAAIDGRIRQLSVPGAEIGTAIIDLSAEDVFGVPILDGSAELGAVEVAGFDVRSARLTAARSGASTDVALAAELSTGTVEAEGTLSRNAAGFAAALRRLVVSAGDLTARLAEPTRIDVAGEAITLAATTLEVGQGRVTLEGTVAQAIDVTASLTDLPLEIADAIRPQLGIGGRVSGTVSASGPREALTGTFSLNAAGVTARVLRERGIDPLSIVAEGRIDGTTVVLSTLQTEVAGGTLEASGTVGDTLDLSVRLDALPLALANAARPDLGLSGTLSGNADVSGTLEDPAATIEAQVRGASAALLEGSGVGPLEARLSARYADGTADIESAVVEVGEGRIEAQGRVGQTLDLTATLTRVPLALANGVRPELDVSGELSGRIEASGSLDAPDVRFEIEAPSVTAAPLQRAGLPAASITATGTADRRGAVLEPARVTIGGAVLEARGRAGSRLDLTVTADGVPLALANGVQPGLGLAGTLTGRADVTGTASRPNADFSLNVANLSANALDQAGVGALSVSADGRFDGDRIVLSSATASGDGLSARAEGTVPLSGGGLDLRVTADAPLSLADRFLASRGTRFGGQIEADVRLSGALSRPNASGTVRGSGLAVRDAQLGLDLAGGTLVASLSGDRVVIETLRASSDDGAITASGSIGLTGSLPADLTVRTERLRVADGRLYAVTFSADLSITGPLLATPLVAGTIVVDRAEINVPTSLSGSPQLIEVEHFNIPRDVLETLRRARAGPFAQAEDGGGGGAAVRLDITIEAPNQIFIRGRGIDAELGGQIRLTGPANSIVPVGRFELIRGRLSILGERIDFREGSLTFFGDLDPTIRLVAESRNSEVTVRIIVEGEARDPQITITSDPELPQDEALAQLLFGRSIADLSAFQLAQLAASVAELAGGGQGPSLLEQVRVFSGFDDIDIVSDPDGGTAARAGRYIADNVYIAVQAGTESSGVSINLDVTRGLKLRAEALTDESTFGVFYEREY